MIQAQIFSALSLSSDIIALANHRIYPVRLPQNVVLPAVVYQIPSIEPINNLSGDSGLDINRVIIRSWAITYSDAHALAAAVRNTLINTAGIEVITESQSDEDDLETLNFCVVSEYSIWSVFDGGAMNPVLEMITHSFDGDDTTTDFTFPSTFRSGTLLVFKNGALAEKDVLYTEMADRTGISFLVAPAGGSYGDKFIAFYAKS